jgi:mannose-6-phosphate isomerase-like protein (cupin superfamily)
MAEMVRKSFEDPDEVLEFPKTRGGTIRVGGMEVSYGRAEPGWRWKEHMGPAMEAESCPIEHTFYVISGRLAVKMDNGTTEEFGRGTVGFIPPGHDAWVVGAEPWEAVEFKAVE